MSIFKTGPRSLALACASLVLGLWSTSASAVDVNCADPGPTGSIQANIGLGNVTINVTGTCNESVFIGQSNVSIFGAPSAVIIGGVSVQGATRVVLRDLTINGRAVSIGDGAFVTLNNVTVENTDNGVFVVRQSGAFFINSTLGPSQVDDGAISCGPLCALDGSLIRLQGTTVTGNTSAPNLGAALAADRDSSILLRGGNTITNGGTTRAILVTEGSSLRQDNATGLGTDTITGGGDGVAVLVGALSVADIRQATVNGDIDVAEHSMVRLGSTVFGGDPSLLEVNGDINLALDSGLIVLDPLVTITGDVKCKDQESSLSGTFQGGGEVRCSGFGQRDRDRDDDDHDDGDGGHYSSYWN